MAAAHGLEQEGAAVKLVGLVGVFPVAGDKDDVDGRMGCDDPAGKAEPVHARHVYIQKGDIVVGLLRELERRACTRHAVHFGFREELLHLSAEVIHYEPFVICYEYLHR